MKRSIFACLLLVACSDEEGLIYTEFDYYRGGQLKNVFRNEIQPLHLSFESECLKLKKLVNEFYTQQNEANLTKLQAQWHSTILHWKRCELYNIGPIERNFIHNQLDKWPINENTVEAFIAGSESIDEKYIASRGSNAKGLATVEYLIFNDQKNPLLILADLSNQRRLDYLKFLIYDLHQTSVSINTLLVDYKNEFESLTSGGPDGGQNQLVNNMVALLEEVVQFKIGRSLGNEGGGSANPEFTESYHGQASLDLIKSNLKTLERCYTGEFAKTPFRIGFDEILGLSGNFELSQEITGQIKLCHEVTSNVNIPLHQAVLSQRETVESIYDGFRKLLILIKVDLAGVLGSTVTFTDNDGD